MAEKVELRGRVPVELYDELIEKTPGGKELTDSEFLNVWLQYANRQADLDELRAAGQFPTDNDDS